MDFEEYEYRKKKIKMRCRTRFGLIIGGLAGLLLGGKFALKTFDIDITEFPWNLAQLPAYAAIGAATVHYSMKEPRDLFELKEIYKEDK